MAFIIKNNRSIVINSAQHIRHKIDFHDFVVSLAAFYDVYFFLLGLDLPQAKNVQTIQPAFDFGWFFTLFKCYLTNN